VDARYPESLLLENERQIGSDYRVLIRQFQVHHHTRRCQIHGDECKFGYPTPVNHPTEIQHVHYLFCGSKVDRDIVTHNLKLLALFRCHHCLEVIQSEKCIGYILKYCSKNSDVHPLFTLLYEGAQVSPNQRLQRDATLRISSVAECFWGDCWRTPSSSEPKGWASHCAPGRQKSYNHVWER
jgi:hypothetical protein